MFKVQKVAEYIYNQRFKTRVLGGFTDRGLQHPRDFEIVVEHGIIGVLRCCPVAFPFP